MTEEKKHKCYLCKQREKTDKYVKIGGVIILLVVLAMLYFVVTNINLLSTHPCTLCEGLGGFCVPNPNVYPQP